MKRALLIAVALMCGSVAAQNFDAGSMRQPPLSQMYIGVSDMAGYGVVASDVGLGVGGQRSEISTLGIAGYSMTTADDIGTVIPMPLGVDRNYSMAFRVWFTSDVAGADNPVWKVHLEEKGLGTALEAQTGLADVITFTADTLATQYGINTTAWDTLGTAALAAYNDQSMLQLAIELDALGGATADEIHLLGVQIVWIDRAWQFRGSTYNLAGSTYLTREKGLVLNRK